MQLDSAQRAAGHNVNLVLRVNCPARDQATSQARLELQQAQALPAQLPTTWLRPSGHSYVLNKRFGIAAAFEMSSCSCSVSLRCAELILS